MSIIEYKSELTVERIKRKQSKDGLAFTLIKVYDLLSDIKENGVSNQNLSRIDEILVRIAWGE